MEVDLLHRGRVRLDVYDVAKGSDLSVYGSNLLSKISDSLHLMGQEFVPFLVLLHTFFVLTL
ncbi:MAG: hypothetical protein AB2693_23740 [Candidatus Thiodiazotropha sp.]